MNNEFNGFTDFEANDDTFRIRYYAVDTRSQIVLLFTVNLGYKDIQ